MATMKQVARELTEQGTRRSVVIGGLTIDVDVLDVKESWGRTRYLVTPVAGGGEVWVESIGPATNRTR